MSWYNNFSRTKRVFGFFLFMSFLFWFLPFMIRLFLIDGINIEKNTQVTGVDVVSDITSSLLQKDRWSAFCMIFNNNIKVCIINIIGGVMLGIVTMFNLVVNGFLAADTFANLHDNGMKVSKILECTLPHSVELVGIWVSGAIGFSITLVIIDLMRGKEMPSIIFFRTLGKIALVTILIILFAAFIETYISIPYK